ncbi:MAG: hypothetical protein M3Y56_03015, partial [Armatimonadota bacterium]|nr:hypothetical protein [Armatimonadota bacterium]
SMNDYARTYHPGQAVTTAGNLPAGSPTTYYLGLNPDNIPTGPSNTILLYECVQTGSGGNNRNGSIYFGSGSSRYGATGLPTGSPEEYHQGNSDFLFCDAHVKAMHPTNTWTSATDPQVLQYNAAYVSAMPGGPRMGQGTVDMWNPGIGGSVYP